MNKKVPTLKTKRNDDASWYARLEVLHEITQIQCNDGNWNYDPYMQGMANGMLMALSVMDNTDDPGFLDALEEFIHIKCPVLRCIHSIKRILSGKKNVTIS